MSNAQNSTVIAPSNTLDIVMTNSDAPGAVVRETLLLTTATYVSAALAFATSYLSKFDTTEGFSIDVTKFEESDDDSLAGRITVTINSVYGPDDEAKVLTFACVGRPY